MLVHGITPILNVSNMAQSFAWFESHGWRKLWDWGSPPTFGAVGSGKVTIFLCLDGQGSRDGPPPTPPTSADDEGTAGVWMSWWLDSPSHVDEAHALAVRLGHIITRPPTNEPWGVREFHLRHPDGHTFRVSASACPEEGTS